MSKRQTRSAVAEMDLDEREESTVGKGPHPEVGFQLREPPSLGQVDDIPDRVPKVTDMVLYWTAKRNMAGTIESELEALPAVFLSADKYGRCFLNVHKRHRLQSIGNVPYSIYPRAGCWSWPVKEETAEKTTD